MEGQRRVEISVSKARHSRGRGWNVVWCGVPSEIGKVMMALFGVFVEAPISRNRTANGIKCSCGGSGNPCSPKIVEAVYTLAAKASGAKLKGCGPARL